MRISEAIGRVHPGVLGRTLPLNGAAVGGAALVDAGVPVTMLRGVTLLARTAGLLGQLAEELEDPVACDVELSVHERKRAPQHDPAEKKQARRAEKQARKSGKRKRRMEATRRDQA